MKNKLIQTTRNSLCTLSLFSVLIVSAQENTQTQELPTLEPYVASAERMVVPVSEVGSSVTVITAEQLKQQQVKFVHEALRQVPGVNVRSRGGPGATSTVSIRGFESEQVLILVDGKPITDSSQTAGPINLATVPVENIERIEVVRGPQTTVHGADAMAGTINIVTKKATSEPVISVEAEGGSFDTYRSNIAARGQWEKLGYSFAFSQFNSDGFSSLSPDSAENDDYVNYTYQGHLDYAVSNLLSLYAQGMFIDAKAEYDAFATPGDNTSSLETEQLLLSTGADLTLLDGQLKSQPSLHFIDTKGLNFGSATNGYESQSWGIDWENTYQHSDKLTFVGGAEYQLDEATNINPSESDYDQERDSKAVYLLGRFSYGENLFVNLGGRIEDYSDFGSQETWRASASYLFPDLGTRLHGTYGTAFRAPTLGEQYDTFGGFALANPNLQAEESDSFDVGIEQSFMDDRITIDLTYFYNDITNQIVFDFSADQFRNIGKARTQGYELTTTFIPHETVTVALNYTWLDTLDRSTGTHNAYAPNEQLSANVNWAPLGDQLNIYVGANYVGDRFAGGGGGTPMSSYTVWNSAITYAINENLEVFARIENIFNKDYQEINGYATADQSGYIGFSYKFQ